MGYNDRNSQGRQPNRNAARPPREIAAKPLPANYVDEAERVIRSLYDERNKISTNKIRNLLSLVSEIYNRENLRTADTISEESASGLIALRIRMVYEAGRDDAVKLFLERAQLLEYIKGLGDSRAKLMDFAHYMEALVAYSKKEGIPEREYLNTLRFARDSKGKTRLDAVSSLLRGVLVSDSEPIPNNAMTLTGKRDAAFGGEVNAINLCREAVAPGTRIRFSLTLDQSVLHGQLTAESIVDAIEAFDRYYEETYACSFALPEGAALGRMNHCLILGGGAGFFSKSLAYPYYGEEQALHEVSAYMHRTFRGHYHQYDEGWGMSPHMMKYTQWNGKMYPYGICEVSVR